jgi:predicted MPP superfamily phosphohydrolase
LATLAALYDGTHRPRLERITLPPNAQTTWPSLKIVQLSDLHMATPHDAHRLARAVALANAQAPHIVVLTGDYIKDDAANIALATPYLKQLKAPLGVYAVLGNHDMWADPELIATALQAAGVHVLLNEGIALSNGEAAFYLAGLEDGWSGQPNIVRALTNYDGQMPIILLWHEPDIGHDLVAQGHVWLLLAGHSHGGQIRIPGVGPILLPAWSRRYSQGLYAVNEGWVYVNRGLGTTAIPLRLFCPPEVTLFNLYMPPSSPGATQ